MKTERFELRLDRETLERVDNWRAIQSSPLSRAEAVRRLVDAGWAVLGDGEITISDGEKIILMMLRDLYKHQKISDGEIDPDLIAQTIWGGHYWGLKEKLPGLLHGRTDNPQDVSEVVDVLTMWYFIESGYEGLEEKDRTRIELEAKPYGKHVKFLGFDGNSESDYLEIAYYLINKLGRFTNFSGRDLNAHMPNIDAYRRMLVAFRLMYPLPAGGELSVSQIIDLLKARGMHGI